MKVRHWILLIVLLVLWLAGPAHAQLPWNASFEATPANSDLVSEGDDRLRELKQEVRDHLEADHCLGTGTSTGCTNADDGQHRLGSARVYFQDASPGASLLVPDADNSSTMTNGRLWVDSNDSNRLRVYDASWEAVYIGQDAGDIVSTNLTTPQTLAATPTALTMVNPAVTVPASGTYDIEVTVTGTLCSDSADQAWGMDLVQDPAGTPSYVASAQGNLDANEAESVAMHYYIEDVTNSATYTFGLRGAADAANNVFVPANESDCGGGTGIIEDDHTSGTPNFRISVRTISAAQ